MDIIFEVLFIAILVGISSVYVALFSISFAKARQDMDNSPAAEFQRINKRYSKRYKY